MKKILFYINTIRGGGAERVMVNLADFFSQKNYDVVLVTSFRDIWEYSVAPTVKRITLEENEIKRSRIKRNLSRIKALREVCKQEKPDVIVSFMAEPNFRAILATRGLSIKTLVSVRNDPNKEYAGMLGWIVGKIILPMADGCVFQTVDAKRWFPKRLQRKSTVIYNAVKEEFFHIERRPIPGEIVTCGRLVEQKNHAMLIDAFANVAKENPTAILKIYGEGNLRAKLQKKIDDLGLTERALLMGKTSDVGKALQTADIFVLSSNYEGMPNALMEAMAVGVPCISTDCPCGGPKVLLNGEESDSLLVDVGDDKGLANAILQIVLKDGRRKQYSDWNRHRADDFRPAKILEEWEEYIRHILKKSNT